MLRSGDNNLIRIAVLNLKKPCTATLADYCTCPSMESPVGHTFLNTGLAYDVYLLPDLELLDHRCDRGNSPLSQFFLELISCLFSWTVVMCHFYSPLAHSITCMTSSVTTSAGLPRISARLGFVLPLSPDMSSLM